MARVTVEDCLDHCPDQFALVHLAANRYRQLSKGSEPLVGQGKNKLIVTSLREVATGQVRFRGSIAEALLKARQERDQARMRAMAAQRNGGVEEDVKAASAFDTFE